MYTLRSKDQVYEAYEDFKAMAERQTGLKLKVLRSDNGREFINGRFSASLRQDGIRHQRSCPYTPEQNGIAERMNRTILEKVRSMLNDAKMQKKFWAEAVNTAVYLINRCPTRTLQGKTPEEAWTGKKPYVGHLKIFGSVAMVHVPKQRRLKLDPKSTKCVFVGYADDVKGYRLYNATTGEIIISRDVKIINEGQCDGELVNVDETVEFLEIEFSEAMDEPRATATPEVEQIELESTAGDDERSNAGQDEAASDTSSSSGNDFEDANDEIALPPQSVRPASVEHEFRRSGRERRHPGKYTDFITYSTYTGQCVSQNPQTKASVTNGGFKMSDIETMSDPVSYEEALSRPDRQLWLEAMQAEINALGTNQTWRLEDLPVGAKAIKNKWVFKIKRGPNGEVDCYKARLVVKGCSQRPGIDYDEVYAPVVRYSTLRYLMALAVKFDLEIDQMDAVTAFLQGKLEDEVIHMQQPEGFVTDPTKVCRLQRSLYGLKQSSRIWNQQLDRRYENLH